MTRSSTQSWRFSAWAWDPHLWISHPSRLLHSAQEHGVDRLYVTLTVSDGEVALVPSLLAFLEEARRLDMEVFAVEGDPDVVFSRAGLSRATARARAIGHFKATTGNALAGVQYDVEPYTRGSWRGDERHVGAWCRAIRTLAAASREPIELVLPAWMLEIPHGTAMLEDLLPCLSGIVVMAYRTRLEAILETATPLMVWARAHGIGCQVALECLASESSKISFRGNFAEVLRISSALRSAFPGSLRIALHGIDWTKGAASPRLLEG